MFTRSSEWDAKVRAEIRCLLDKYSADATLPMHVRLSQIPVDAWECSTPVLEAAITETVRIATSSSHLRRNMGQDIEVNGLTIKQGEFMLYPVAAENLDPVNYPDPLTWDPARWVDPERLERERSQRTFLGWGVGE
jgi:cytochrome P450